MISPWLYNSQESSCAKEPSIAVLKEGRVSFLPSTGEAISLQSGGKILLVSCSRQHNYRLCLTQQPNLAELCSIFLGEGGSGVISFILKALKEWKERKSLRLFNLFYGKTFVKPSSKGILREGQGSILGTSHRMLKVWSSDTNKGLNCI